jgi:hypothetical protein
MVPTETAQPLCLDFETFYDSQGYSLKNMSTWNYVHDDRFDAYLLAAHNDEISFVGHPKDFDWSLIHGRTLLAHNAYFDGLVLYRLRELELIPKEHQQAEWLCTADMAAYLRMPRNLAGACSELLDVKLDKSTRSYMQGKTYAEAETEGKLDDLLEYGLHDARYCFQLWKEFHHKWPEAEQLYSQRLRNRCWRGLPVNAAKAEAAYKDLDFHRFEICKELPWVDDGYKPLSPKGIREYGRAQGIPVPASLDKKSKDAIKWFKDYGDKYPWVRGVRDYRSLNAHCNKVETVWRGTRADGTLPVQIKYFGAHTGRNSAGNTDATGGKFNPLNMNRKAAFGTDIRNLFEAPDGYTFIICDYDQIEAIVLLWCVNDFHFLEEVAKEGNVYQAYAKRTFGYTGDNLKQDDEELYQRAKVSVLQLGYQSGWVKFQHIAEVNYDIILTESEAKDLVYGYRKANPKIVNYWELQNKWLLYSANHNDDTHEVELRSGRDLVYFRPRWEANAFSNRREVVAQSTKGGRSMRMYGGLLTENEIQATARDILVDGANAVMAAGHDIVLDVYDENVILSPEDEAEDRAKEIEKLMTTSSAWAAGCPIGATCEISKVYKK